MIKRRFGKLAVYGFTLTILFVSVMPNTFNIPVVLRPWIFLASIMWIYVFSSSGYNS
jgi:hypothetical protein